MKPEPTARLGARPLRREQIAYRLLRDLDAEFVAIRPGAFWVAVAAEDPVPSSGPPGVPAASHLTEERVEVVDANRASADDIRRILDDAIAVIGSAASTVHGQPLRRMIDLHYDVPVGIRSLKDRVNRYVFGYRLTSERAGRRRSYRYDGVVHRMGVRWIGQSVLRLPPSIAEEVESQLRAWGVPVSRDEVFEGY